MQSSAAFILLILGVAWGFKIGEDSIYNTYGYNNPSYSSFKFSPNNIGDFPMQRASTVRAKFAPTLVEVYTPTGTNVLITNPGQDPLMTQLSGGSWSAGISIVVAVGPNVALSPNAVKEGDLVYTNPDCPLTGQVWLNKPTGDFPAVCRAIPAAIALYSPVVTDAWCQLRGCSEQFNDKCQWVARGPNTGTAAAPVYQGNTPTATPNLTPVPTQWIQRANYCVLPLTSIRGIVNPSTNGAAPTGISRLVRPRDKWMSWRRDNVNKHVSNTF